LEIDLFLLYATQKKAIENTTIKAGSWCEGALIGEENGRWC
jgi:hypothetical protein